MWRSPSSRRSAGWSTRSLNVPALRGSNATAPFDADVDSSTPSCRFSNWLEIRMVASRTPEVCGLVARSDSVRYFRITAAFAA